MYIDASRRAVLRFTGAALVVGCFIGPKAFAQEGPPDFNKLPFPPNAFLRIAPDNTVTVIVKHIEFGQGPNTGLATLVAEELDADWSQMRAESAPTNDKLYANPLFGYMGTGGSSAIKVSYIQMRKAGAAARSMLVTAAAKRWNVPPGSISVDRGVVSHAASGKRATFGDLAAEAARLPVPANPILKQRAQFRLIGAEGPRIDSKAKSTGEAVFTFDLKRPDLVHSAILHPPAFNGKAISVDDKAARAIPGVLGVERVPEGLVVFAKTRWAAMQALPKLNVSWDLAKAETRSSEELYRTYAEAVKTPGAEADKVGQGADALNQTAKLIEAEYRFPFLAHAPMEPMNAVVDLKPGGAEMWLGSQMPTQDQRMSAKAMGLKPDQVKLHTMIAGGSFGRLATPNSHFAVEVGHVAKAWRKSPVKHAWTRETDIRGGYYRPLSVHRLRGGLDASGQIIAWDHVMAIQSFFVGSPMEPMMIKNGVDEGAVEGSTKLPYNIPNQRVGLHLMKNGVPTLWWRSVGNTHTAYVVQTFLDELLTTGGQDPVQGRLKLLKAEDQRYHGVLKRAAEMASWSGSKAGKDRARGVAVHKSFDSYVAQIAEVSRGPNGLPCVHKVWCAVDCGVAVNPDVVRAQMEGCIGFGLGAILYSEVQLGDGGKVVEGNFNQYRTLRINEMPEVEVSIIKSDADPTGVGEPGVPPIGPAVANAWRALTSQSVRQLPFARSIRV